MFRCPYGIRARVPAPSGSRMAVRKVKTTNDDGECVLIEVEHYDLQEQINSFKDFCLIENILKRYMNGDNTALNASPGVFMNTLGLPHDIFESKSILSKAKDLYGNMPTELKEGFPSFDSFVRAIGSKDGIDAFYKRFYEIKKGVNNNES